jgi:hypothetical protein
LDDISTRRVVGMYFVPGHAGVRGNEIADKLARDCSVQKFVGPELSLWASTQNMKRKIQRWLDYQHFAMRRGPSGTQRQARKLFSGPSPTTNTRLLSFNRTKSRVVIGLLTGHTLKRYLQLTGLTSSSLCRRCGTEEETSVHRHAFQGSFCLGPGGYWESKSEGQLEL